jgi:hypothetical protein
MFSRLFAAHGVGEGYVAFRLGLQAMSEEKIVECLQSYTFHGRITLAIVRHERPVGIEGFLTSYGT